MVKERLLRFYDRLPLPERIAYTIPYRLFAGEALQDATRIGAVSLALTFLPGAPSRFGSHSILP